MAHIVKKHLHRLSVQEWTALGIIVFFLLSLLSGSFPGSIFAAEVAVDTSIFFDFYDNRGNWGPIWTDENTAYFVYLESEDVFNNPLIQVTKTIDGGATWSVVHTQFGVGTISGDPAVAVWFDQWTPGDSGGKIHISYVSLTGGSRFIFYYNIDTANSDQVTSEVLVKSGSSFTNNNVIAITKARNGNLYVGWWGDDTAENGFERSTDGGASWTSRADVADGVALDWMRFFPGNESDTEDIWAIYWDRSADEISLKVYDDSADSWSETLISSGMVDSPNYLQFSAAQRHSDNHVILAAWSELNAATADLRVWDIGSAGSIVAKADVITNEAESSQAAVFINQQTDDIYVAYLSGTEWIATVGAHYKKSNDGGTSWGAETTLSEDAEIGIFRISAGHSVGDEGGKFMPVWAEYDFGFLLTNTNTAVVISAVVIPSAPSPDTTTPKAIEDFTAISQEDGFVLLTWTNSPDSDFKQVRIYRSTEESFIPSSSTEIAQVSGSPSSPASYLDTNIEPNTPYTYKILTEDILGNLQSGLFYPSVTITTVAAEEDEQDEQDEQDEDDEDDEQAEEEVLELDEEVLDEDQPEEDVISEEELTEELLVEEEIVSEEVTEEEPPLEEATEEEQPPVQEELIAEELQEELQEELPIEEELPLQSQEEEQPPGIFTIGSLELYIPREETLPGIPSSAQQPQITEEESVSPRQDAPTPVGRATRIVQETTQAITASPLYRETQNVIAQPVVQTSIATFAIAGIGTGAVTTATFAFPILPAFKEIPWLFFRLFSLVMQFLGFKKRSRAWGVVYNSVTKQPLDPAYVVLKDSRGKKVASAITDLEGRYGFAVPPGAYFLEVHKSNHIFPSQKLSGKARDGMYDNLYFSGAITVREGELVAQNIPMDQINFDWNEFAKKELHLIHSHPTQERIERSLVASLFWTGAASSAVASFFVPSPINFIILGFYGAFLLARWRFVGLRPKSYGLIYRKATKQPLSFAIVRIHAMDARGGKREVKRVIADKEGRYYMLVQNGRYTVTIEEKIGEDEYRPLFTSPPFEVTGGILNRGFAIL